MVMHQLKKRLNKNLLMVFFISSCSLVKAGSHSSNQRNSADNIPTHNTIGECLSSKIYEIDKNDGFYINETIKPFNMDWYAKESKENKNIIVFDREMFGTEKYPEFKKLYDYIDSQLGEENPFKDTDILAEVATMDKSAILSRTLAWELVKEFFEEVGRDTRKASLNKLRSTGHVETVFACLSDNHMTKIREADDSLNQRILILRDYGWLYKHLREKLFPGSEHYLEEGFPKFKVIGLECR